MRPSVSVHSLLRFQGFSLFTSVATSTVVARKFSGHIKFDSTKISVLGIPANILPSRGWRSTNVSLSTPNPILCRDSGGRACSLNCRVRRSFRKSMCENENENGHSELVKANRNSNIGATVGDTAARSKRIRSQEEGRERDTHKSL